MIKVDRWGKKKEGKMAQKMKEFKKMAWERKEMKVKETKWGEEVGLKRKKIKKNNMS